jgi:hypothetical protein
MLVSIFCLQWVARCRCRVAIGRTATSRPGSMTSAGRPLQGALSDPSGSGASPPPTKGIRPPPHGDGLTSTWGAPGRPDFRLLRDRVLGRVG